MYLNIKMLEDFRTLKQGDEFNFDFSKHPEILIAGDNGCGKSTLVNVIRDYQCDNSKDDPNAVLSLDIVILEDSKIRLK